MRSKEPRGSMSAPPTGPRAPYEAQAEAFAEAAVRELGSLQGSDLLTEGRAATGAVAECYFIASDAEQSGESEDHELPGDHSIGRAKRPRRATLARARRRPRLRLRRTPPAATQSSYTPGDGGGLEYDYDETRIKLKCFFGSQALLGGRDG